MTKMKVRQREQKFILTCDICKKLIKESDNKIENKMEILKWIIKKYEITDIEHDTIKGLFRIRTIATRLLGWFCKWIIT